MFGDLLSFSPEEEWEEVLPRWQSVRTTPQAQRLILAGVPKKLRAKLWFDSTTLKFDHRFDDRCVIHS